MNSFFSKQKVMLVLLFASIAVWITINDRAPMYWKSFDHVNEAIEQAVHGQMPGPLSYRVLFPYTEYYLHEAFPALTTGIVDFFLKSCILFAIQFFFFIYLKKFFSSMAALAGTFLLDILLDYSLSFYLGVNVFETTDLFTVLVMLLSFDLLFRRRLKELLIVLFIGMLNRETPVFLLIPIFLSLRKENKLRYWIIFSFFAAVIPYFLLRVIIHPVNSAPFSLLGIGKNIPGLQPELTLYAIKANLRVLLLLGSLIVIALVQFKSKPEFLRTVFWITPFFILIHYLVGNIIESRVWMPLFIVLIPLAMSTITEVFTDAGKTSVHQN